MNNDIDLQQIKDITNKTIDKKRKLAVKQFKKVSKKFHKQCVKGVKKSAKKGSHYLFYQRISETTSPLLSLDEREAIAMNEIYYWRDKGFKAVIVDVYSGYEITIYWDDDME